MPSKKSETGITTKSMMALLEQQNYRCALSGVELTPETASADHKVPIARGGLHHISNLQIIDEKVNQAKGALMLDEFLDVCRRVVSHQDAIGNQGSSQVA